MLKALLCDMIIDKRLCSPNLILFVLATFLARLNVFTPCRKMLIADINELKYQQEDAKKPNAEEEGEGKEDVTFLKLALK